MKNFDEIIEMLEVELAPYPDSTAGPNVILSEVKEFVEFQQETNRELSDRVQILEYRIHRAKYELEE